MASLINPKCAIPLYSISDEDLAKTCGRIDGAIGFTILSAVTVIGGIIVLFPSPSIDYRIRLITLVVCMLLIGIFYMLIPLGGWINKKYWLGYKEQIASLIANGMSKDDAIKSVQSLYQTELQTSATTTGAMIIASRLS